MRVLHISDVHVPPEGEERSVWHGGWRCAMAQIEMRLLRRGRKFRDAGDVLRRIVEAALRLGVDHVVLSGDLTTLALDAEFESARDALGPLAADPARLTVVPGNHDRFTPGSWRERRFERHFADLLESDLPEYRAHGLFPHVRLVGDGLAVVGLDSALVPHFPGLAYGRVGKAQLAALEALLADRRIRGRAVLVAVHHAPYGVRGEPEFWSHALRDADALLAICRDGGVAALLHGHVHDRFHRVCPGFGVPIYSAGSSTEQGREGYWVYGVERGAIARAESVDLGADPIAVPALSA
jgi:3',5'-cyclic AMP phosphodiesterase CpdA